VNETFLVRSLVDRLVEVDASACSLSGSSYSEFDPKISYKNAAISGVSFWLTADSNF